MTHGTDSRPFDSVLRARLHLAPDSTVRLALVRLALNAMDWSSRATVGKPFFALKESEALLGRLTGLSSDDLLRDVLALNGGTRIEPHGLEHVPTSGPAIIASTHPTGMFDFVLHAGALARVRPDLKVVANQEAARFLGPDKIVPVRIDKNNRAQSSVRTIEGMQRHLLDGGALLIFGSGRVPDCRDGKLVEPPWRSGTSRISQLCKAPIVPAAVNARNSRFYYRIRSFGRFVSGGDDNFGAMVGSLRYSAELLEKLGGQYDVHYGPRLAPGTKPDSLKEAAESLVPGLYAPSAPV